MHVPERPGPAPLANPRSDRVKAVRRLSGRSARVREGRFAVEGPQAVREAVAGPGVLALYATDDAAGRHAAILDAARARGVEPVPVTDEVMAAMTETVTPQGLLAVCRLVDVPLADVVARAPRLVAVLAHVRDPGNAGTAIRAADAAGADAVVLTDASVDVHNPKCVRSTAGSLFHLPVVTGVPLADAVAALRAAGLTVYAADGAGDLDLDDLLDAAEEVRRSGGPDEGAPAGLAGPVAWVFGNEAWGLPEADRALADAVVRVPVHGQAESLNLGTAATVCLYAAARAHRPL
ncbi:MAG: RNA methyltransferase [Actinobacteria bacterium]|nr:RNA methyltransferase [Actinomycetota bacterium]